jgi:hypothetical protein
LTTKGSMSRGATVALVLAVTIGRAPSPAWAQDATAAMTDEARRLYDEGRKAKGEGDHATCVAKLRAAWALVQHRQVAGLLGECELRTGAHREAAEHLAHYLDHAGDASPEAVAAVRALYDEARAEVAVVTVKASAEGADRKVDGRPLAPQERRVFLAPGEHLFAASKPGVGSGEKRVFVSGGQERDVVVELAPHAAAAPAASAPAYAGPTAPPAVESDGPSVVPGLVVGGLGLVGVGVGVGLLAAAGGAGSDAEAVAADITGDGGKCEPITPSFESRCAEFFDAADRQSTLGAVGAASLIGGGVLLAGGAAWVAWAALDDGGSADASGASGAVPAARGPRPSVAFVPEAGPGGGALRVRGTFW